MPVTNNSRVLLVRHGRMVLNGENRLRGHLDPSLDEVGRTEVAALGEALAAQDPVRVVSSPLRRAVQTAESIAGAAGLDVVVAHGLIDRDYGRWAGHTQDELIAAWGMQSVDLCGLPLRQKIRHGARGHAAHRFELPGFLAVQEFSRLAQHCQGRHALIQWNVVAYRKVQI